MQPQILNFSDGTQVIFTTPSPVIAGETLVLPEFDAEGNSSISGLQLKREIAREKELFKVSLRITNNRTTPVRLDKLIVMDISGPGSCRVADCGVADWSVMRLARQKNDLPGPFRPSTPDNAMRDAVFISAEIVAGNGISWSDFDSPDVILPHEFHCDPAIIITPDQNRGREALFIGFAGQTLHMDDIVLTTTADRQKLDHIQVIAEFDHITLNPGESRWTHEAIVEFGEDCDSLMTNHIERIVNLYGSRRIREEARNVYCTWYFYSDLADEQEVLENLETLAAKPVNFDVFQMDMGWQNNFGDWGTNFERFPHGMTFIADQIKASGFIAGIWTCPFVINPEAEVLKRYPNLILYHHDGRPAIFKCALGDMFILDPFSPSAKDFLIEFYQKLLKWGYRYHKLDFLRAVMIYEDVRFASPGKNRAEAYRRGVELIREALGEEAIIVCCGGLFEASVGLFDITRSGADVQGHWQKNGSHISSYALRIRQNIIRSCYNRFWYCDADALQLRRRSDIWRKAPSHLCLGSLTDEEAFSTVVNQFIGGGIVCASEKLNELDDDRYALYNQCMPIYADVPARVFGDWKEYLPNLMATPMKSGALGKWCVVSVCNWNGDSTGKFMFFPAIVHDLPPALAYAAFEFRNQKFLGVFKPDELITLNLPEHAARLVRLAPLTNDGSYLIGTSLNMSMGGEIAGFDGNSFTMKEAVSKFPCTVTVLDFYAGKITIRQL